VKRGAIGAYFNDPAFLKINNPSFLRLGKQLQRDARTSGALKRLTQNGVDEEHLIVALLRVCAAYRDGWHERRRNPIRKSKERKNYETALRILARDVPNCILLLETHLRPMLEAGAGPLSSEARAVRSLMDMGTLDAAIAHLRRLAPVLQQLHAREPVPRFVKPSRHLMNTLFGVKDGDKLDIVRTATPLSELQAELESFCAWCAARYSGSQLCGDLSPVLNAAFEMFDIRVEYPKSAKTLGTFLRRQRKKRRSSKSTLLRNPSLLKPPAR
jgi:hypothetical protein